MDSLTTLTQLGSGKFIDDLAAHLKAVSQEVVRTGNPGTVAATLKVERFKDTLMVTVAATVQPRPPAEKPLGAMFYAVDDELWRDDPRQARMEFTVVDTATGEIRTIDDEVEAVKEAE